MKQVLTSMWFNWARPAGGFCTVVKTLKIRSTQSKVAPAKKEIPTTRAKKRGQQWILTMGSLVKK